MLPFRTVGHLARSWLGSYGKTVDGLHDQAVQAMKTPTPDERFANLNRLLLDVGHQERREPRRAVVLRAALLDLMLDALQAWSLRDPALGRTIGTMTSAYGDMRQRIDGDDQFEEEVESVRSSLRS
jgi:hypothetical protein